jgi:hypothetical protein
MGRLRRSGGEDAERGDLWRPTARTCTCAHVWVSEGHDRGDFGGGSTTHRLRCRRCDRKLEREEGLTFLDVSVRYVHCGEGGTLGPCRWPGCVAEPRTPWKRVRDRIQRALWWVDAHTQE